MINCIFRHTIQKGQAFRIPFGPLAGVRLRGDPSLGLKEALGLTDRHDLRYFRIVLEALLAQKRDKLTVVDAGANMGLYSLFVERVLGPRLESVYAFEPNPSTYERLRENVKLNGSTRIIPIAAALSSEPGRHPLQLTPDNHTAHMSGVPNEFAGQADCPRVEVECETLDRFFDESENRASPDLIKMDIEGGATQALLAVDKLVQKSRPWFFIESHIEEEDAAIGTLAFRHGYRAFDIKREVWVKNLTTTYPDPEGVSGKLILVPPEGSLDL